MGGVKESREEEGGIEVEGMEMKRKRRAIMQAWLWYKAMVVKEEEV